MAKKIKAPKSGDQLFDGVFKDRSVDDVLADMSSGIDCVLYKICCLLSDIKLLVTNDRLASAAFLLATAREELSKIFILIDMCRLDFTTHESTAKRLCAAFYNHISKHAYLVS